VIQSPLQVRANIQWIEQFTHAVHQAEVAGRGIHHLEQFAREAAEIVDGARRHRRGDRGARQVPVRGDGQHCTRPGHALADRGPAPGPVIDVERVHRIAMTEEDCRIREFMTCPVGGDERTESMATLTAEKDLLISNKPAAQASIGACRQESSPARP